MGKKKDSQVSKLHSIEDLRVMLFSTLERLMDGDDSMDAMQARSIANISRVIVDSAKLEVELIKKFGTGTSKFLPAATPTNPLHNVETPQ